MVSHMNWRCFQMFWLPALHARTHIRQRMAKHQAPFRLEMWVGGGEKEVNTTSPKSGTGLRETRRRTHSQIGIENNGTHPKVFRVRFDQFVAGALIYFLSKRVTHRQANLELRPVFALLATRQSVCPFCSVGVFCRRWVWKRWAKREDQGFGRYIGVAAARAVVWLLDSVVP